MEDVKMEETPAVPIKTEEEGPVKPTEEGEEDGNARKKQKKTHQAVKYHCNYCSRDIGNIRIKCAICTDFDLCVYCFAVGVEIGSHIKSHDYHVMEALNFPFFTMDWGADEELLLLEGIEIYGLGNWRDISEHVGTKSAKSCKEHYWSIYMNVPTRPLPDLTKVITTPESLQERNRSGAVVINDKEISEDTDSETGKKNKPPMKSSHYSKSEAAGYMTLRGDFETDYENDAELILADLAFNDDDNPTERDLKLRMVEIYNQKLDERARRKQFILERGLLEYKKVDKKRPKEEKEVYDKTRPFARLLSREEHEQFVQGLLAEKTLRNKIRDLKMYRKMGIHTLNESQDYDVEKRRREHDLNLGRRPSALAAYKKLPPKIEEKKQFKRKPEGTPLDITTASGYELLSEKERELCSSLRLFPQQYLVIKDTLIRESIRQGPLKKATARQLIKIDVNKTGRIFDFFENIGWINRGFHSSGNSLPPIVYHENQPNPALLTQAFIHYPIQSGTTQPSTPSTTALPLTSAPAQAPIAPTSSPALPAVPTEVPVKQ